MTNEEFQSIVLNELKSIKTDINELKTDVRSLKTDVNSLKTDVNSLKEGQERLEANQEKIERFAKSIYEQTADLMEFRVSTEQKLDEMNKTIRRTEIATADNWSDIAKLKSII